MQNIEKKVRKNIRINKLLNPKDKILVIGEVSKFFIKKIVKDPKIKILYRKIINKNTIKDNKINKVINEKCLDDNIKDKLNFFFTGHNNKTTEISIFNNILTKDLEIFAKKNKLSFIRPKDDIDIFLDKLEARHPGSKNSFLKVKC